MTQAADIDQALSYIRHQAAKSLADLTALVERTAADFSRCLEDVSEDQATFKPAGEWSIKEVLDHVIDSTALVNERIRDLAAGKAPRSFVEGNATSWAGRTIDELRRRLADLWEETVSLVTSLPEEAIPPGTWEHPLFGPLNLREMIAFHRLHALDHVQQIEKIKAAPGCPAN